jgi:hypothetical protein
MRRFGTKQAAADGGTKVRAIDNAAGNDLNDHTTWHEMITCISVAFVMTVACAFHTACIAAGSPMARLAIGLDDMSQAFRRIPTCQPWYTTFAIWSYARNKVEYYFLRGSCFGAVSSVINFSRFPALMVAMARVMYAVPCANFMDDYICVDIHCARNSGQACLESVHALVGQGLEEKKRKPMAGANVALGVMVSVARAHTTGAISMRVTKTRIDSVLRALRTAKAENRLMPGEASSLRGKLGFIFNYTFSRFGRAVLQPLVQREYHDISYVFTTPLTHMLDFLEAALPSLPEARFNVNPAPREHVVVYSDAAYRPATANSPRYARIAFVAICASSGRAWYAWADVPEHIMATFSPDLRTYICQIEALAAVAAYYSIPNTLRHQDIIHFIDNTAALSALINGYASKPDMGRITNAFHIMQLTLLCYVWLEWVPSAANVADLPSRGAVKDMLDILPEAVEVPLVMPPVSTFTQPLARP